MTASTASVDWRILVVEDDANERVALQRLLMEAGYHVSTAESADKALSYLEEPIDCVLTDLLMGDVSGMDLLKLWKRKQPEILFLMMTGHGSVTTAVEAIQAGAYHYLTKPIDPPALLNLLQNMVRQHEQRRKMLELQNRLDERFALSNIIGRSPGMQRVFELIRRSAHAFSTVLILGESGTGKELVAQAIHQNSQRRDGPYVAVNCAAMPATLVETELFGHEKGAFTGAIDRRIGRFEAASGGTLFIDEIGEFEVSLQVKLLRVLESRVVTPVGGNKEIKVDTRVVAATSRDIRDMMSKGQFREDLYYRLNVITIDLPPLRSRMEDIPLLVKRFMERVNEQNGTHITSISPAVVDALQTYHWPGNVRELLNIVERMMVLTDKVGLEIDDLPSYIRQGATGRVVVGMAPGGGGEVENVSKVGGRDMAASEVMLKEALATMTLDQLEEQAIAAALERFNGNRTRAARALGISVRTLQRKLGAKHGTEEGENDPAVEGEPVAAEEAGAGSPSAGG